MDMLVTEHITGLLLTVADLERVRSHERSARTASLYFLDPSWCDDYTTPDRLLVCSATFRLLSKMKGATRHSLTSIRTSARRRVTMWDPRNQTCVRISFLGIVVTNC
jgi:hypothetical protein